MSALLIAAAAVIVALALQRVVARANLNALRASVDVSADRLEPGAPFDVIFTFENRARRPVTFFRYALPLPEGFGAGAEPRPASRGAASVEGSSYLRPRQRLVRRVSVTAPGRGRYVLHGFSVFGGDFLGVSEAWREEEGFVELVVYPRAAAAQGLDRIFGGLLGDMSVRRFLFEDPVLTAGMRDYTGREPMKQIAWSQSAKRGALTVRAYDHTTEPSVSVILNLRCAPGEDSAALIERCFELARAVCEGLEARGAHYDFCTNAAVTGGRARGTYLPEGLGRRHLEGILELMGRAQTDAVCPPQELARRRAATQGALRGAVLISPRDDPDARAAADILRAGGATAVTVWGEEGA